ncbi:C-C motif chemokine 18-like [Clarias gariepinus]|uniref:C-C motif chemokine 18-like n=1 Tax=Clarias gariepinus TaxID=13013 RepID=UPI00234C94D4|nr:C-C motif chemokine 18-like [Clarias gariepinus]
MCIFILNCASKRSSSPSEAMFSTPYCLLLVLLGLPCVQSSEMEEDANGANLCCFEFHKTPLLAENVVSYQETRPDCTIPGIIFTTTNGYSFCADPEVDWVKKIIKSKPSA